MEKRFIFSEGSLSAPCHLPARLHRSSVSFINKKGAVRPRRAVASALGWGPASCRVWLPLRAPGSGKRLSLVHLPLRIFSVPGLGAAPGDPSPAWPGVSRSPPPHSSPRPRIAAPSGGPLVWVGSEPLPSPVGHWPLLAAPRCSCRLGRAGRKVFSFSTSERCFHRDRACAGPRETRETLSPVRQNPQGLGNSVWKSKHVSFCNDGAARQQLRALQEGTVVVVCDLGNHVACPAVIRGLPMLAGLCREHFPPLLPRNSVHQEAGSPDHCPSLSTNSGSESELSLRTC